MTRQPIVHVPLADALSNGPPPTGNLAVPIFSHGSLVVELYTPVGHDPQKPHTRDEVYFVARGSGQFFWELPSSDQKHRPRRLYGLSAFGRVSFSSV
jgi:hypothetical protein